MNTSTEIKLIKMIVDLVVEDLNAIDDGKLTPTEQETKMLIVEFQEMLSKPFESVSIEEMEDLGRRMRKSLDRAKLLIAANKNLN